MSSKKGSAAPNGSGVSNEKQVDIQLPQLKIARIEVNIRGITPLMTHKWSEKALRQMRDKQQGRAKMRKDPKDPEADFQGAKYLDEQGRDCVPLLGFKNAIVSAARYAEDMKMTVLRGALRVENPDNPASLLLPIQFSKCVMREDVVRVGMGTADLRYRPEYHDWKTKFVVAFNRSMLSAEQVLNLVNLAGFSVGLCEWRPEKDGMHGQFEVAA